MLEYGYYNMDCMQGMKDFPDGYFDLAVVDPPVWDKGKRQKERYTVKTGNVESIYTVCGRRRKATGRRIFSGTIQSKQKPDHFRRKPFYFKNAV